jgi:hypothetical protein
MLALFAFVATNGFIAAQERTGTDKESKTVKLDGEWTVVYIEIDGKAPEKKGSGVVTIKNNVATCKHDGKEMSWKLEFGPHHMVRCTELVDGKTTSTSSDTKATHTHHGVYIASQDYFTIGMMKGMDRRFAGANQGGQGQRERESFGPTMQPRESHFVLILRRAGTTGSAPAK